MFLVPNEILEFLYAQPSFISHQTSEKNRGDFFALAIFFLDYWCFYPIMLKYNIEDKLSYFQNNICKSQYKRKKFNGWFFLIRHDNFPFCLYHKRTLKNIFCYIEPNFGCKIEANIRLWNAIPTFRTMVQPEIRTRSHHLMVADTTTSNVVSSRIKKINSLGNWSQIFKTQ